MVRKSPSAAVACYIQTHFLHHHLDALLQKPCFSLLTPPLEVCSGSSPSLPELSLSGAVWKDAVSSETEDSDGALKPGPPSNLLYPEKTTALESKEQNPEAKWWRGNWDEKRILGKKTKVAFGIS